MSAQAPTEVLVLPYNDEDSVAKLIRDHRQEMACVILDPKAGILPVREDFILAVREITQEYGVLLILDEIVSFRVGTGGLQGVCGITPDLTTFGKIVGGGFPVGAFGGRADIMNLFDSTQGATGFFQSGTFSAHPLAMVAGLATLRQLTPDAFAHLNALGDRLRQALTDVFERKGIPSRVAGLGSVFSIHFTKDELVNYRSLARTDKTLVSPLFLSLIDQGYYMSPPLAMNSLSLPMETSHVDGLIAVVDEGLDRVGRARCVRKEKKCYLDLRDLVGVRYPARNAPDPRGVGLTGLCR